MRQWLICPALAAGLLAAFPLQAQTGSDGGIIPPVLRRPLPSRPAAEQIVPYGAGEAALPAEAIRSLDRIADRMRVQPRARVVLYGFADPTEYADAAAGRVLALRRAEAARDYLLLKGLAMQGMQLEIILPSADYRPPPGSALSRPASYVKASIIPWAE